VFYHTHQIQHHALAIVPYALAMPLMVGVTRTHWFYHNHQILRYALSRCPICTSHTSDVSRGMTR
jgi:hypothetical protein